MTFCPDCEQEIPGDRDAFVAHRALEHPPQLKTLTTAGIASETRFGTDPEEGEDNR